MAIINYTDQLKYTGKGYIDAKMMPVQTFDDLKKFPMTQRFEGLSLVVLNNGDPQEYWLVGGISNSCWKHKNGGNFDDLRLTLEDGFLKLTNNGTVIGDPVDLNDFFPSHDGGEEIDLYIETVDYTTSNDKGDTGIFMCFTYSDNTKKYLDMSQFVSNIYEPGNGIVIDGNVISIDSAITGKFEALETKAEEITAKISIIENQIDNLAKNIDGKAEVDTVEGISARLDDAIQHIGNIESNHSKDISDLQARINEEKNARESSDKTLENTIDRLDSQLKLVSNATNENKDNISLNSTEITTLKERIGKLESEEELVPDGTTIGATNDEQKSLYVKVLEKDGNILSVGQNEIGETGLYAYIPVFYEDDELNNE